MQTLPCLWMRSWELLSLFWWELEERDLTKETWTWELHVKKERRNTYDLEDVWFSWLNLKLAMAHTFF